MIVKTLGRYENVRHSIVEDSKYLIGVFQEPATPLPSQEHHDPPDTPPPSSSSSSNGRSEFATPTKPAPNSAGYSSSSGGHPRLSSSMKPPSGLPGYPPRGSSSSHHTSSSTGQQQQQPGRPASTTGLHKAPGPGPGGGSGQYGSSNSSSLRTQSNQRPGVSGGSVQRPHPPKLAFGNLPPPLPPPSPSIAESPDVNDILKEMKAAALTPLTAIAATPRKESVDHHFNFINNGPPSIRRMASSSSGSGLMDDLNISDSDQDSETEVPVSSNRGSGVLSPLPDRPLMSVPSPLGPLGNTPPRTQHHQPQSPPMLSSAPGTAAPSEVEESDDESSSESEGSSSDSSSGHSEPDTTKTTASPKVNRLTLLSCGFLRDGGDVMSCFSIDRSALPQLMNPLTVGLPYALMTYW